MGLNDSKKKYMNRKLDDINKKPDFKLPEGYFEDLPLKIQNRIEAEKPKSRVIRLPTWSLAMAASVVAIVSLVFLLGGNENKADDLLAEISEEDLVAYIEELDLDEYDLASAFPETTEELEFKDIEIMDGLDLEDHSIDDILLEYNLALDDIVI